MNPPAPPKSKPEQIAKGLRLAFQGQGFTLGVLTGIILSLLARLLGA